MRLKFLSAIWTQSAKTTPFNCDRPGDKFVRSLKKFHQKPISCSRSLRQNRIRSHAINANTLTTHIAAVEQLIKTHDIDPCRVANLDETSATVDKKALVTTSFRIFTPRDVIHEYHVPTIRNVSRVTIVPEIFASGETRRSLFLFKNTWLLHRVIESNKGMFRH